MNIISYGIATEIMGHKRLSISLPSPHNIALAKEELLISYPGLKDLVTLSFAVGAEYRSDDYVLKEGEELVIIPPVSGG